MKDSKPTPGPWFAKDGDIAAYKPSLITGHGNRLVRIADYRSYEAFQHKEVGYDEIKANAALIAAAPDLLDALEKCADMLERVTYQKDFSELLQARAAIAKAKGKL